MAVDIILNLYVYFVEKSYDGRGRGVPQVWGEPDRTAGPDGEPGT